MKIGTDKVEDAVRDLVISVSPVDIEAGIPKDHQNCAVAKACNRQELARAIVHLSRVYIQSEEGAWLRYFAPHAMSGSLVAFDRGGEFVKNTFTLKAPKGREKLGHRRAHSKSRTTSKPRVKKREYTLNVRSSGLNQTGVTA